MGGGTGRRYQFPPEEADRLLSERHLFAIREEHAHHPDPKPRPRLPDDLAGDGPCRHGVPLARLRDADQVSTASGESQVR
jgi:hypothetical protein